jgi:RND superfamily putative drug exporter
MRPPLSAEETAAPRPARPARHRRVDPAVLPAGRRTKWLVVLGWLILVGALGPLNGRLESVQENDAAAFLPGSAESTRVLELQRQLPGGQALPAVAVYQRDGGLTPDDQARIDGDRQRLAALAERSGEVVGPIISQDGTTALLAVPLDRGPDSGSLASGVDATRRLVGSDGDGLRVEIAGPAGFVRDRESAFGGIDKTLLVATAGVVAALLLVIYRSPVLWLVPLLAVGVAEVTTRSLVYLLARYADATVNGQSAGIALVLVFGAGTDYALLLIARYREELSRHQDHHDAMAVALRRSAPAIVASAATVSLGLLCLLASSLNNDRSLGPVGTMGVVTALAAALTLLPALLVIFGRRLFWPFVPRYGEEVRYEGLWARLGEAIARRPRPVWLGTVAVLGVFCLGLTQLSLGLGQSEGFRTAPEAVRGQRLIDAAFPAGTGSDTVVVSRAEAAGQVRAVIAGLDGVAAVREAGQGTGLARLNVTLADPPDSAAAFETVDRLRAALDGVPAADGLVGGPTATALDTDRAASRDRKVVIPLVVAVVLLVLCLLLRSLLAPVLLMLTVVLSFAAALGASAVAFEYLFGFAGTDTSLPLLAFVFLVALGVDYNIFLLDRVREEAKLVGTRAGTLRGLAATGGVITSAGIVLAATFTVLAVLPPVVLTQVGFAVGFGVLLDTILVRSVLVPGLFLDIGRRVWWPSRLGHSRAPTPRGTGVGSEGCQESARPESVGTRRPRARRGGVAPG